MSKKISILFILLVSIHAEAKILFAPAVTFLEQKQEDPARSDSKLTLVDVRLGYLSDFGLYIGGLYSLQDHQILSNSADSYLGPSVGYYKSGFFLVGTYYLYGEKDLTNGSGKYAGASGYQLDLSYTVPITPTIRIGPQLTYHYYKYSEIEVSGVSNPASYKFSSISPYFNLIFVL